MQEDDSVILKQEAEPKQPSASKKGFLRKFLKAIFVLFITFIFLNLALYIALSIPWVQQKVVNFAIEQLKPILKTEMSIREVQLSLFNNIDLKGVYLEDQQKDTLLYAERLGAKLDLWQLIHSNTLVIKAVDLEAASISISKQTPESPFNFQFLIDAFASDKPADTTKSELKIDIRNIKIENTQLRYDVWSEPDTLDRFNPSHIHVKNLNASLDLPSLDMKNFDARLHSLSLTEKSGLRINNLCAIVKSKGNEFTVEGLKLNLAESLLEIPTGKYNFATDEFSLSSTHATLIPKELSVFLPSLKLLEHPLELQTAVNGKLPQIGVSDFVLSYGANTTLSASASISDYARYDTANIRLSIAQLTVSPKDITAIAKVGDSSFEMPSMMKTLGNIKLKGDLKGKLDAFKVDAEALTQQGGVDLSAKGKIDTTFQNFAVNAILHTHNFNLRPFVGDSLGLGRLSLGISAQVKQSKGQSISLVAKGIVNALQYKNDTYRSIPFAAEYSASKIAGWVDANLPIGRVKGSIDMTGYKSKRYVMDLAVTNLQVNKFYKMDHWISPLLSLNLKGDLNGTDINHMTGNVEIKDLCFEDSQFTFETGDIILKMGDDETGRFIDLQSSIMNANVVGNYDLNDLADEISGMLHPYLPYFFDMPLRKKSKSNKFSLSLLVNNTEQLSKIFNLPIVLHQPLVAQAMINSPANRILAEVNIPDFAYGDMEFKTTNFDMHCDSTFEVVGKTKYAFSTGFLDFDLGVISLQDTLSASIYVKNDGGEIPLDGELKGHIFFDMLKGKGLVSTINLLPTDIKVNNLNFSIMPASIRNEGAKTFIEKLGLQLKNKPLFLIEGIVSNNEEDKLHVSFEKTNIGSVLEAFNVNNVEGVLNGNLIVNSVLDNPEVYTENFVMSDIVCFGDSLGTLNVDSRWNAEKSSIDLNLALENLLKKTKTTIQGSIHTQSNEMDITMDADQFPLAWIQPFFADMISKLGGSVSANIDLKGQIDAPAASGWLKLNDAAIGIAYTNAVYHISDSIAVSPNRIGFDHLILEDEFGNYGLASATVNHKNFKDLSYKLDLTLYNLLVLNTEDRTDSLFYGKVFTSGHGSISGNENNIDIKMNVQNSRNSTLNILLPQTSEASKYSSIVYINTPINPDDSLKKITEEKLPIHVNVDLKIDPRMNFRIVIDPTTNSDMYVKGDGQIKFDYDMQSGRMTAFGEYNITEGIVKYNLKKLKTLDFAIRDGSQLLFSGDPMNTSFNIKAYKRIKNVDITTLDPSLATVQTSPKVNTDCVLNISGNINKMDLSYDIDLPDAPDDLKRKVKGIISTDEQRVRQFASLAAFGTFYSNISVVNNVGAGILSDAISGSFSTVLNSVFSNVLGDKWEIGTDFSTTDASFSDLSANVNISRKFFNNKLKFNTNLGYRSEQSSVNENSNNFVGDFDVEYELSQNWKVKAYQHANDEYYKQSSVIYGVGINYSKDAKTLKELFRLFGRKKKKAGENKK